MSARLQKQRSAARLVRPARRKHYGCGGPAMSIAWCVIWLPKHRDLLIPHDLKETQRRAPGTTVIFISAFREKRSRQ